MVDSPLTRRRLLALFGAAAAAPVLSACGSSVGGGTAPAPEPGAGGGGGGTVRVGLVVPLGGVYAGLGEDMKQGWDLWLAQNGGKFGNYTVETVEADEGETPQTGGAAVQQVLQSDGVDIVVGIVNSAVAINAAPLFAEAKKVLVVANAGAAAVTGANRNPYVWRASFQNAQIAAAMGTHLGGEAVPGGIFVIAPDYAAGDEVISGFSTAYEAAGGTIAGTVKPPFGSTTDYQPFLTQIQQSGAGGTFCFFSGAEALSFVTQYEQFGLKATTPLYGSGFLTEGDVLQRQGPSAVGVQTTLHYSSALDNPANQAFASAYEAEYGEPPTTFAMQTWDSANVLNRALATATALDGDSVSAALGGIGTVDDSPRGPWTFEGQSPLQNIYLRTVEQGGDLLVNAITEDLGQQGQVA
jgi:branched-chain amino acid transport system substrate-binding protein